MAQNENIKSDNLLTNDSSNGVNFSFGKSNNYSNNYNNKINKILPINENNNNYYHINDKKNNKIKKNNGFLIFNLLNRKKDPKKEKPLNYLSKINNINQSNNSTKPKLDVINNNFSSPKKQHKKLNYYSNINNQKIETPTNEEKSEQLFKPKNNNLNNIEKEEMLKLFNIKDENTLPYEIKYFFNNSNMINYDFLHQEDCNSNYQYSNENFIDILLNSFNKQIILNSNKKPIKEIQKEITFTKRNILISWLTEINLKYIKDQNVLFTAIKYLDKILYKTNININEFQLIGILCFNLALKMENHHKVFFIDEIISLIGGCGDKDGNNKNELAKKIINMENIICDILDFDFEITTSVLILQRLIQMLNIRNPKTYQIFYCIAYFFLELSLYDEQFYELDEFVKALTSLLIAKEILIKCYYKIGFHNYLIECSKLKKKEIKYYYTLCTQVIKNLKSYKYGTTIFIKYQHKDFHHVFNNYLSPFIIDCIQDKNIFI
jgi:hypothetical protein